MPPLPPVWGMCASSVGGGIGIGASLEKSDHHLTLDSLQGFLPWDSSVPFFILPSISTATNGSCYPQWPAPLFPLKIHHAFCRFPLTLIGKKTRWHLLRWRGIIGLWCFCGGKHAPPVCELFERTDREGTHWKYDGMAETPFFLDKVKVRKPSLFRMSRLGLRKIGFCEKNNSTKSNSYKWPKGQFFENVLSL